MIELKGYVIPCGYMGYVEGSYQIFATEADYRDYIIALECERYDVPIEEALRIRKGVLV